MSEVDLKLFADRSFLSNFTFTRSRRVMKCEKDFLVGSHFMAFKSTTTDSWEDPSRIRALVKLVSKGQGVWLAFRLNAIRALETFLLNESDLASYPDPSGAMDRLLIVPEYYKQVCSKFIRSKLKDDVVDMAELVRQIEQKEGEEVGPMDAIREEEH